MRRFIPGRSWRKVTSDSLKGRRERGGGGGKKKKKKKEETRRERIGAPLIQEMDLQSQKL